MRQAWAVQGQDVAMVEWKQSAATGWGSSENSDSEGPQTAAVVCAAEQVSWVESGCMLEINQKVHLRTFMNSHSCWVQ